MMGQDTPRLEAWWGNMGQDAAKMARGNAKIGQDSLKMRKHRILCRFKPLQEPEDTVKLANNAAGQGPGEGLGRGMNPLP